MPEVGRPTDYTPDHTKKAKKLAILGLSNKAIADVFEVAESTIYEWKKNFPEFSKALTDGKIEADARVASKLYKRAVGYRIRETTYERIGPLDSIRNDADGINTSQELYRKRVVVKHIIPDVGAQTLWLRTRQPDTWRDNRTIDHNFNGPVSFVYNEQPGNEPIADDV